MLRAPHLPGFVSRIGLIFGTSIVLGIPAPVLAIRQIQPVTVDGHLGELDQLDSSSQVDASHSSGRGDADLLHLRITNDDSFLYIGLACRLPSPASTQGILILLDGRSTGSSFLETRGLPPELGLLRQLHGTMLEKDFAADHAVSVEPQSDGTYRAFLVDLVNRRLHTHRVLGQYPGAPGDFQIQMDPREDRKLCEAAQANRGLEMAIPLRLICDSAEGIPSSPGDSPVRVFAASVQTNPPHWSNHTLPPSVPPGDTVAIGGTANHQPNFSANTRGALPHQEGQTSHSVPGLIGFQSLSAALPATLSRFSLTED